MRILYLSSSYGSHPAVLGCGLNRYYGYRRSPRGPRRLWNSLGELPTHPFSAAARLLRPLRGSVDKASIGSCYFIHPEREVDAAIATAGLAIDRVVHLSEGSAYTRQLLRFTPLRIYVLEKQTND